MPAASCEALSAFQAAVREAIADLTLDEAAALARVHVNTLSRILAGFDVKLSTAARVLENLGGVISVRREKPQRVVGE
jgi:hypothetical protein